MRPQKLDCGVDVLLHQVVDSANPIVFAKLGSDPSKPTITIHGHYDVQVLLLPVAYPR